MKTIKQLFQTLAILVAGFLIAIGVYHPVPAAPVEIEDTTKIDSLNVQVRKLQESLSVLDQMNEQTHRELSAAKEEAAAAKSEAAKNLDGWQKSYAASQKPAAVYQPRRFGRQ